MRPFRTGLAFTAVSIASVLLSAAVLLGYLSTAPSAPTLRVGFFANLTHATALVGIATGEFQRAFGTNLSIQPIVFNAGPVAIMALLRNQVDVIYVGPSPTLNGLAAAPDRLRIIAGAASGGAAFVVQPGVDLSTNESYAGKKFASPLPGNTQDLALRHFLLERGHQTLDKGGDVDVVNIGNAEILSAFRRGQIDGAWIPEPWTTRLVLEAQGRVHVDERDLWLPSRQFVTTHVVTTKKYLDGHRDLLAKFLRAHVNLTLRLQRANDEDLTIVNDAIEGWTRNRLDAETLATAYRNFRVTYDPIAPSLKRYLEWAQDPRLGFIPPEVDAASLYDLSILNEILEQMSLPPVSGL